MKFSKLLTYLLAPFFMFAVDGEGGGGAVDRGDDFEPTDDDDEKVAADAAAEIARIEAEKIEKAEKEADPEDEDKEEKDDKEEKEEKTKGKKDTRIPLARHKELLEKGRAERDALIAENARLKQGTQLAKTNEDIDATEDKLVTMEVEYNELLGKGELKDAAKLMTEIRRLERTISDAKADFKAQAASDAAYERVKYDTVVARIEDAYPQLNVDSDEYDSVAEAKVVKLFTRLTKAGDDRTSALQEAVLLVMGSATTGKQRVATEVDPRVTAEQLAKERKESALKRNVDASNRQPADTSKVGLDGDKRGDVLTAREAMKMSQKDFAGISESELRKMRGDEL